MFDDVFFGNPKIDPDAFVSRGATLIGDIIIEPRVIVASGARLRADECGPFFIGAGSNVQEGARFHGLLNQWVRVDGKKYSVHVGCRCSITHGALVHGPTQIGDDTLVGFDATVHKSHVGKNCTIGFKAILKNANIGDNCVVETGADIENVTIRDGSYVPHNMVVVDQDVADQLLQVTPEVAQKASEFAEEVVHLNNELVAIYKARRLAREKQGGLRWLFWEIGRVMKVWYSQYR
jgi:carbon dioxide concentrating mechanism protein CcmM